MSRASNLILFGILLVITPFTGIPVAARSFITVALGACVISIGVSMRAAAVRQSKPAAPAPEPEGGVTPPEPPHSPSAI